jgi:hypothetical protein
MIVWPICNFRSFSIWLYFCSSFTGTLCILAMEVSVSPRATTWVLPFAGRDGSADAALVEADGVASPIMTPGRVLEICCSSFRICCESVSIFAFCSSIFFDNASSWAASEGTAGVRANVCAEDELSNAVKKSAARFIANSFIAPDFDISRFRWQASRMGAGPLAFASFSLSFFVCRSAFKSQPILFRGGQSKVMATGLGRLTYRDRTQRIS